MPTHELVRAAVLAVWGAPGRRDFNLTIEEDGTWSRPEFELFLGPSYQMEGYNPYGREGIIMELIAEQTGGRIECPEEDELPPGAVY
jgi:hypothetical protein